MKKLINMVAATVAAVGLVGCVGGIDDPGDDDTVTPPPPPPPPTTQEGKRVFETEIHPILAQCGGCHNVAAPSGNTSGFYDPNLTTAYATMISVTAAVGDYTPTGAGVYAYVKNGDHAATSGIQTWDPDADAKLLNWLSIEVNERAGQPNGTPPPSGETPSAASERLIREWSGCMTLDDFTAANMPNGWGDLDAQNNQQCENCHSTGGNFFIASRDTTAFFNGLTGASGSSLSKYLLLQYFKVDLSQGVENAKVVVNETSILNVATGGPGHNEHPRFNPNNQGNNRGLPALTNFYNLTMAHKTAGTCGPPRLP